jgi:hypothetical protein
MLFGVRQVPLGLTTVGYALFSLDSLGVETTIQAQTKVGVTASALGYNVNITPPPPPFIIRWIDDDSTVYAEEDVNELPPGTQVLVASNTSTYIAGDGTSLITQGLFGDSGISTSVVASNVFSITPSLPTDSITNGQTLYWTVSSLIKDASGNIAGQSSASTTSSFLLDAPEDSLGLLPSVGSATYSVLQQVQDPLSPLQFEPTGISPGLGEVHQELMNTPSPPIPPIIAAFSVALASGQENLFRFYRTSLYDYQGEKSISGSWALSSTQVLTARDQPLASGTAMIFTSTESYLPNCRYTVDVSPSLTAVDGQILPEGLTYTWVSWYTPFHIDPYRVRQRLGEHSAIVSNEDLYYQVWRASVKANRELLWYLPAGYYRGGPSEQEVINFTVFHSMALAGYVEIEATIRIFEKLIGRAVEDVGISEAFKESEVHVSPDRIKSIAAAIKALRPEWESYRAEISMKRARPRSVIKSSSWRAGISGRDLSYTPRGRF